MSSSLFRKVLLMPSSVIHRTFKMGKSLGCRNSVCLSVAHVLYGKTIEPVTDIFIPHESVLSF